jgi:hypothetical protein
LKPFFMSHTFERWVTRWRGFTAPPTVGPGRTSKRAEMSAVEYRIYQARYFLVFGDRDDEQSVPHHERPLSGLAIHDKSDLDGRIGDIRITARNVTKQRLPLGVSPSVSATF